MQLSELETVLVVPCMNHLMELNYLGRPKLSKLLGR